MLFALFLVSVLSQCETQLCTPSAAIGEMKKTMITKLKAQNFFDNMVKYIGAFAFFDIAKNPPQPESMPNYHTPVDIQAEINTINTFIKDSEEQFPLYDLFIRLFKMFALPKDLHFALNIQSNTTTHKIGDFLVINPFTFQLTKDAVYIKVPEKIGRSPVTDFFDKELVTLLKSKDDNNISLSKINGIKATEFIENYAKKYFRMKNTNAAVTLLKNSFVMSKYENFAIEINDMNFMLSFSDKTEVNYTSVFFNTKIKTDKFKETIEKYNKIILKNEITRSRINTQKHKVSGYSGFIGDFIKKTDFSSKQKNGDLFNYSIPDVIACGQRVVSNQKFYILVVYTFNSDFDKFLALTDQCKKLFDESDDPIVVILDNNSGGTVDLSAHIQDSLAPYNVFDVLVSQRISESTEIVMRSGGAAQLLDPKTKKSRIPRQKEYYKEDLGKWYDSPVTDVFVSKSGGESKFVRTQKSVYEKEFKMKYNMKNVRNPNQIIMFTDQFCFSACSFLSKDFRQKNAALLVAYSGLPYSTIQERDVGQSPTVVITDKLIRYNNNTNDENKEKELDEFDEYGFEMQISFSPTYPRNVSFPKIPDEYNIHYPHEYFENEAFEESEESITKFLEEAQRVFEKYRTRCDEGMYIFDDKCIGNKDSVGGHICQNGQYNYNKCVLVGCKNGLELNQTTGFCGNHTSEYFVNSAFGIFVLILSLSLLFLF
ncbi:hypothetical protein EIN_200790 [Entamoeba invadens IP1]|uniref:Tail specific protease domain-containing protein n=1 Tax=Entamoeba invadens IP1 TaxID=370355 RepID=L7FJP8_ENTIV|nr:hypothetical protein EIN_200790 [Entamoeba invadens IP1]ELP83641.1 hypothetical protein EIN_200790 [Entamoeba invadens IP1]|eukprot:XP_004182987.1 hypothetical protein EIN_200790 [Entamoeba invadens IP1]